MDIQSAKLCTTILIFSAFYSQANVFILNSQPNFDFDTFQKKVPGFELGYTSRYKTLDYFITYQHNSIKNFTYESVNLGAKFPQYINGQFSAGTQVELGIGEIYTNRVVNKLDYLPVGGGGFANYKLSEDLKIISSLKYIYYIDLTPDLTCNDGSALDSYNDSTCSHHNGIEHYNELLGSGGAFKFSVGLELKL